MRVRLVFVVGLVVAFDSSYIDYSDLTAEVVLFFHGVVITEVVFG